MSDQWLKAEGAGDSLSLWKVYSLWRRLRGEAGHLLLCGNCEGGEKHTEHTGVRALEHTGVRAKGVSLFLKVMGTITISLSVV